VIIPAWSDVVGELHPFPVFTQTGVDIHAGDRAELGAAIYRDNPAAAVCELVPDIPSKRTSTIDLENMSAIVTHRNKTSAYDYIKGLQLIDCLNIV
jgi:hypothetical protein